MSNTACTVSHVGLLQDHDSSEGLYLRDFELEAPVVVLWKASTVEIDVRQSQSRRWHFRPRPGLLDLYGPGTYESFRSTDGRRHKLVLDTAPIWHRATGYHHGMAAVPVLPHIQFHDRALERLMLFMAQHQLQGEPFGTMFSEALAIAMTDRLSGQADAGGEAGPYRALRPGLRRLLMELIEHRLSEPPSIDAMAALASMGTSLFLRAFRASFGMPPHQYVMALRVERAKLLLSRDAPLSDLAAWLGFASHAHFTTVFRARTGTTPSEYRRTQGKAPLPFGDRGTTGAEDCCATAG